MIANVVSYYVKLSTVEVYSIYFSTHQDLDILASSYVSYFFQWQKSGPLRVNVIVDANWSIADTILCIYS